MKLTRGVDWTLSGDGPLYVRGASGEPSGPQTATMLIFCAFGIDSTFSRLMGLLGRGAKKSKRVSPRKLVFMVDLGGGSGHVGGRAQTFEHRLSRDGAWRHGPGQARPRRLNFICFTTDFTDDTDKKGRDSHP